MPRPSYRLRRLVTVVAAAFVLGVAVHGVCQAIEHHGSAGDAIALCVAAAALVATVRLAGGARSPRRTVPLVWFALLEAVPVDPVAVASRRSPSWLQRFQN